MSCLHIAISIHLVSVVFGTAIPTSLNIFGKCFLHLYIVNTDKQLKGSSTMAGVGKMYMMPYLFSELVLS